MTRSTRAGLLYETAKNSSWPLNGLENKGPLKVLNGTKLILDNHGNNLGSFKISLQSFRSFRGPLHLKPVTVQELFLSSFYSKPAVVLLVIQSLVGGFLKQNIQDASYETLYKALND